MAHNVLELARGLILPSSGGTEGDFLGELWTHNARCRHSQVFPAMSETPISLACINVSPVQVWETNAYSGVGWKSIKTGLARGPGSPRKGEAAVT